jgi:hypothetical protein
VDDVRVPVRMPGASLEQAEASLSLSSMTKCVKPLRHLATSSTKSSKWSVMIGRAGTRSDLVAVSQSKCLSGLAHFVIYDVASMKHRSTPAVSPGPRCAAESPPHRTSPGHGLGLTTPSASASDKGLRFRV